MGKKLTKRVVESIQPPQSGATFLFDSAVTGFGVRTTSGGIKTYIWQGRVNGRKQRLKIGRTTGLSVEKARNVAKQFAGELAEGKDPRAERHRRRVEGLPLKKAFDEYLQTRDLKPTTRAQVERARESLSDWLSRPIATLTRDMVAQRHRKLGRSSPAYANLVMRLLRAVLNLASEAHAYPDGRPLLPDNPVKVLSATKSWFRISRRRTYILAHDLPKWMEAVRELGEVPSRPAGTGRELPKLRNGAIARDFFMLLLLTGLRRSEALDLKWQDVDFEGRTVTISDPKNRQAHTLPLSDFLYDLLDRRRKQTAGDFVFSDGNGTRLTNFRYALQRVEHRSGVKATCHDLRRTFATAAESLDIPAYAVKALLNHKTTGDVTAGYIQMTPERLRAPMQKITDYFLKAGELERSTPIPLFESVSDSQPAPRPAAKARHD